MYVQNASVCTVRTSPCVPATGPHVLDMRACCRYTRRRPDRTHGGVLNVHTGGFSACQASPTPHVHTQNTNTQHHMYTHTKKQHTTHPTDTHTHHQHNHMFTTTRQHDTTTHNTTCAHNTTCTHNTHKTTHPTHHSTFFIYNCNDCNACNACNFFADLLFSI